jgi:hypothetical protein
MADETDPERVRRENAFWKWSSDREPIKGLGKIKEAVFVAGAEYEASLLEGLLEHMGRQTHGEFELLSQVADVLEGWTGSMDDHAQAGLVFEKVKKYVKLRNEMAAREAREDDS